MERMAPGRVRRVLDLSSCALRTLVAVAALTLASGDARAITFDFTFQDVNVFADGDFVGLGGDQDITGFVSLDVAGVDLDVDPTIGNYNGVVNDFGLSIGGTAFLDFSNLSSSTFRVFNGISTTALQIGMDFGSALVPGGPVDDGFLNLGILFEPPLGDDAIPSFEDLAGSTVVASKIGSTFQIFPQKPMPPGPGQPPISEFVPDGSILKYRAQQDGGVTPRDPSNPIPEPTGALLFAGGLLVAARAARRRRSA